MDGNYIHHNSATRGGGISIYDAGYLVVDGEKKRYGGEDFTIKSGRIEYNTATDCGGGIGYTHKDCYPLHLTNVIITENTAARGGGIWGCPTSETTMYATQGGAVYGNTATGETSALSGSLSASGDDTRYEGSDTPDTWATLTMGTSPTASFTAASRALGGGLISWYADEAEDRYQPRDSALDEESYTNRSSSLGLHAELDNDAKALAFAESKLIVRGNTAGTASSGGRGGGIATNSAVVIGLDEDVALNISAEFESLEEEEAPLTYVDIYRVDAESKEVLLDEAKQLVAPADTGDLAILLHGYPSSYLDADGNTKAYSYTVKERDMDGWALDAMDTSYDAESRTYFIKLKYSRAVIVSYNANGGGGTMAANRTRYQYGADVTVLENEFNRAGYVFVGWNTQADGNGTAYASGDLIQRLSEDITLFAQWKLAKSEDGKETPVPELPQTGDAGNLELWLLLLTFAASGLAAVGILGRKRGRGKF